MRPSTIGRLILACLWLLAWAMPMALAQDGVEDEPLIKAAYIYNFAKFTHWPESAMGERGAPLSLCVAGEDDLVEALGRLRGRPVKGRPLAIQTIRGGRVPRGCHMLYVATSEQQHQADILKSVRGQPILTVSELPRFAQAGGVVELFRRDDRIRFVINLGVARGSGLEISPGLLNLAVVIGQEKTP